MSQFSTFSTLAMPLLLCLLGGCAAGLGEDFSCNEVGGVAGCTTMNEVRDNLDVYATGNVPGQAQPNISVNAGAPSFTTLPMRNRHGEPERTMEVKKKVTIFPFTDKDGRYIDTTHIYFILDESRWTGRPASAIWKD